MWAEGVARVGTGGGPNRGEHDGQKQRAHPGPAGNLGRAASGKDKSEPGARACLPQSLAVARVDIGAKAFCSSTFGNRLMAEVMLNA